ncbi:hypothetical protein [Planococcus sp. SSTMD024]|uniref:hypothetical protein n=1 Tax=Planococcus sp. SSTMD024 TaxID=3242163 RepID=UPI00351F25C1
MECQKCGHKQSSGKFCGKCGNSLQPVELGSVEGSTEHSSLNSTSNFVHANDPISHSGSTIAFPDGDKGQSLEKAKEASKLYWDYVLTYIKKPSAIFGSSAQNLLNALITLAIFFIFVGLVIHNMIEYVFQLFASLSSGSIFSASEPTDFLTPSLVDTFPNVFLFLLTLFALSFGSIFLATKLVKSTPEFKQLVTVIGTLLMPAILFMVAAYLLFFVGMRSFGNILFFIGLIVSFLVVPLYAIAKFNEKLAEKHDSLFSLIAYTSLFLLGSTVCFSWFLETKLKDAMSSVFEILNFVL